MEVVCELMRLKPERVQDYIDMHNSTWPELIEAIRRSGFIEEYIYNVGTLVIVVMKCENFASSVGKLQSTEVFRRWTAKVREMLTEDEELLGSQEKVVDLTPIWDLATY